MLDALRSLGLNGKVRLVGFDSSEPLLQAVRDGDVDGLIVQDPYRMGYLGVWTLVQHLEGYDVSAGGKDLSTGEYVVTKENLDTPSNRASCSTPTCRRNAPSRHRCSRRRSNSMSAS